MVKRKGIGYSIEAIAAMFILLSFAATSFTIPSATQDWRNYQRQIAANDLSYALQKTGHLENFMRRGDTGSVRTAVETISSRDMKVSGTVSNLPILETSIGFHTLYDKIFTQPLYDMTGDPCQGDIEEIKDESEAPVLRTDPSDLLTGQHQVRLYFADTDPKHSGGGFDGTTNYESLWVDNGTQCQFSAAEGPFYLDEFFFWGNKTGSGTKHHYDFKAIDGGAQQFKVYRSDQVVRLRDTMKKRVNGVDTDTEFDTFKLANKDISVYDVVVFRRKESLTNISSYETKLKNFMEQGSVMLAMNPTESQVKSGFIADTGLEWVDLNYFSSSSSTTCPTSGSVVISSDCTYGPGAYRMSSFTVQSGATVHIDNSHNACDTSYRGSGCSGISYTDYAPRFYVDGPVDINGVIEADEEGFKSQSSGDQGPGAGESGSVAGGGGYGGTGGDSDLNAGRGGPSYGQASEADRLGSAGGYDTDGSPGGHGGGSLWITANGQADIDGSVVVRGGLASAGAGGGAGGSIRIEANSFTGNGKLSVRGGDGSNRGGGGAGGRIALVRRQGAANVNELTSTGATETASQLDAIVSGGDEGNTGYDGQPGSLHTAQQDFTYPIGRIGFSESVLSSEVETYFVGQEGSTSSVTLSPGSKISSSPGDGLTTDEVMVYSAGVSYDRDEWNATNMNMNPTATRPPGAPTTSCNEWATGSFNLPSGTYDVVNTHLGTSASACNKLNYGLSIDKETQNGNYGDPGEGPFLNGEEVVIDGRVYKVKIYAAKAGCNDGLTCAELVYSGAERVETVNYRTTFPGFDGNKLARVPYEPSYSEEDRKVISSVLYWLRGDQKSFSGRGEPAPISSTVVGSIKNITYMPYKLHLRWRR
ncbi:MAG: hypothetical protein ABEJ69_03180 [Candidatus Nanohaloarchaea archaeon]